MDTGTTIPPVSVTTPDGATLPLTSLKGQPLVVYFYPKDDTSGCTKEAQAFSALAHDFAAAGARLLGISKDSPASHAKFIAKYDLTVPLGSDTDGSVTEAFGVWVEKSMYGKKYMGIDRSTFLFDADGTLVREWRKVKVPGHAEEVLAAVKGLG